MPMSLFADRTRAAPPYPVVLVVGCDGLHLLDTPTATFDASEGHPRDGAVRAGWVFTGAGLVLCPGCARRAKARRR